GGCSAASRPARTTSRSPSRPCSRSPCWACSSRRDELREAGGADVAAREDDTDRPVPRLELPAQQGGDADRAARLDDDLQAVEEEDHCLDDLVVGHRDDLVHPVPEDLEGLLARLRRLQA